MDESKEMVFISIQEYEQLKKDSKLLHCLRSAGVDNWIGWDYALEEYHDAD